MESLLKKYYHNKPVLVTGGAGFIGSHVIEQLIKAGALVTVLDNFSTGTLENLHHVQEKIKIIPGDIRQLETCLKATKQISHVFHLAAAISVAESMINPEKYIEINEKGTDVLLQACRENKVSSFVFSSSAAVYGPQEEPCSEKTLCNPQSPYATSKLHGELLCKAAGENGLTTTILRYFNVFGPRQSPFNGYAGVIAKFTYNLQQDQPIILYGSGEQARDFISVEKVAQANLIGGMNTHSGEIFNIASGKSISLLQLLKKLETEIKPATKILFKPIQPGDIKNSRADCLKFNRFCVLLKEIVNQ